MDKPLIHQQITFFMVRDLEATAHFYGELLGLALTIDQGDCRVYRVVGDAYVGFCQRPELVESTRNVNLTLVTPEVDLWYQRLTAAGVSFDKAPEVNPTYNIYHCFARDPDGYPVEIQQFLDPVLTRLPVGASADEVARAHYRALAEGDRELWIATLKEFYQGQADTRGSRPDTWWNAGRRMTEQHGVYYEFDRVAEASDQGQKLFFARYNADGTPRGRPVPIHLINEDGEWRVNVASY